MASIGILPFRSFSEVRLSKPAGSAGGAEVGGDGGRDVRGAFCFFGSVDGEEAGEGSEVSFLVFGSGLTSAVTYAHRASLSASDPVFFLCDMVLFYATILRNVTVIF